MNQVLSFERLVYFGYIFEESGLLSKNLATSPSGKKKQPVVAFGARAVNHEEIKVLKEDLIKNYNVSPIKIRKAGLEELEQLKQEEMIAQAQSRNA